MTLRAFTWATNTSNAPTTTSASWAQRRDVILRVVSRAPTVRAYGATPRSTEPLEERRRSEAAPCAGDGQAVTGGTSLQLVRQGHHLADATRARRMPQRQRAAVDIE